MKLLHLIISDVSKIETVSIHNLRMQQYSFMTLLRLSAKVIRCIISLFYLFIYDVFKKAVSIRDYLAPKGSISRLIT